MLKYKILNISLVKGKKNVRILITIYAHFCLESRELAMSTS